MIFPAKHEHSDELSIFPVRNRQGLQRFIRVPWSIYAGDHCEDNSRMWPIIETVGGDPYKHYRIYQKDI